LVYSLFIIENARFKKQKQKKNPTEFLGGLIKVRKRLVTPFNGWYSGQRLYLFKED